MSKYKIEVEIPDGPYCDSCDYVEDYQGDRFCMLIKISDEYRELFWQKVDGFYHEKKSPRCPSHEGN